LGAAAEGPPQGFWRRVLGPFYVVVLSVAVACLVLAAGLAIRYLFVTSPDQAAVKHAPRITDVSFEKAANSVCKQYVQVFDTGTTLDNQPTERQSGQFLENIAQTFDAMVVKLAALPVVPPDQAAVSHWLTQWRDYDAFGHQYATAVGKGQERDLIVKYSGQQGELRRQRNAFATANHMPSCVFN
jgi:hypothetical protein